MIDPKTIDLMHRVLDGAADGPERAHLERALAGSAEARTHFEELSRLARRLDAVPMSEPPVGLHRRVMSAVDSLETPHHRDAAGSFPAWLRGVFAPTGLRFASTFGLGLAAGAIILAVVQSGGTGRDIDPSHVSGALSTPVGAAGSMPVAIPEAGVSGSVAVVDRGDVTQVQLKVDEQEGTEWVFDVPRRDKPAQSVVLRVVKSGQTVFEGAVQPVEP